MISLWTGLPGAGKTASLVDYLSKLPGDRPLYVHYDPAAKTSPDQVLLSEGLKLKHTPIHADNWPTELPNGAIFVIDEVQDVWRPRASASKVPPAVAALETHRHRGIDVFVTTQSPSLLDANVRALVGRHVHIRDTGILGRYAYEWPEVNASLQWKTCINKRRFKLPKKVFELYTSSQLHTTPVRNVPRLLIIVILLLMLSFAMMYGVYRIIQRTQAPGVPLVAAAAAAGSPGQVSTFSGASAGPAKHQIDDRVDFIPRVSNKPESAPAYDHLRVITVMPVVVSAICVNEKCKCYTAQGSDAGLVAHECRAWVDNPPFNPYLVETPSAGNQNSARSAPGQDAATTTSGVSSRGPV